MLQLRICSIYEYKHSDTGTYTLNINTLPTDIFQLENNKHKHNNKNKQLFYKSFPVL